MRRCIVCGLVDDEYPPSLVEEFPPVFVDKWLPVVDEDDEPVELLYYLFGKRIPFGLAILGGWVLLILVLGLFGLAANITVS